MFFGSLGLWLLKIGIYLLECSVLTFAGENRLCRVFTGALIGFEKGGLRVEARLQDHWG